jgi:hypothetical protein
MLMNGKAEHTTRQSTLNLQHTSNKESTLQKQSLAVKSEGSTSLSSPDHDDDKPNGAPQASMARSKHGPPEESKQPSIHPTFNLRDRKKILEGKKDKNFLFYGKSSTKDHDGPNSDDDQDDQDDEYNSKEDQLRYHISRLY